MIQVTDSAASHLLALLKSNDHSPEEKGLRLLVERGGCAGMSYAMQIASASPGDDVIEKMDLTLAMYWRGKREKARHITYTHCAD